ncbi:hypothetical protein FB645_005521 [Coemansia sp. IMI 203386]|nr:hypothetical protein FB645_005521 [Coemansia sp. IMI 203386]
MPDGDAVRQGLAVSSFFDALAHSGSERVQKPQPEWCLSPSWRNSRAKTRSGTQKDPTPRDEPSGQSFDVLIHAQPWPQII